MEIDDMWDDDEDRVRVLGERADDKEMLRMQEPCDCEEPCDRCEFGTCQYPKQEQGGGITFKEYVKRKPHLYGPVKDEPVGDIHENIDDSGKVSRWGNLYNNAPSSGYLYTRPQPEPVKDEPVAWRFSKGTITKLDSCPHGGNWQPLYTRPQPDLTAEVERLQNGVRTIEAFWARRCNDKDKRIEILENDNRKMVAHARSLVERIAELEAEVERLKVKERDCEAQHGDLVRCNRQLHESITELEDAAREARMLCSTTQ